ncbi:MAG: hypothetical protein WC861_06665 [Candidatus Micrarchaeia archaeon]|jgi:hypothetical protein
MMEYGSKPGSDKKPVNVNAGSAAAGGASKMPRPIDDTPRSMLDERQKNLVKEFVDRRSDLANSIVDSPHFEHFQLDASNGEDRIIESFGAYSNGSTKNASLREINAGGVTPAESVPKLARLATDLAEEWFVDQAYEVLVMAKKIAGNGELNGHIAQAIEKIKGITESFCSNAISTTKGIGTAGAGDMTQDIWDLVDLTRAFVKNAFSEMQ